MKQTLLQEKYPVFVAEIDKGETCCQSIDDVVAYLKARIAEREKAIFIAVFDHYADTRSIGGEIAPEVRTAVDVIFCFGLTLASPRIVATLGDRFVLSFPEAPYAARR